MSDPERIDARLTAALAHLESLIVDDAEAADREKVIREAQEAERRRVRADRLEALGLELERLTHLAVVANDNSLLEGQKTSLRAVQRWLWRQDLPPTLVLVGEHGCGKSVAAAWAAANFDGSVCWYSAADVVRIFSTNFGDERKLQERIKCARLTVLDDVATETDRVRMCAALIEIFEKRKQRKTIITTNQALDTWLQRYTDPRLHSRLKESAIFVTDKGPDLRGTRGKS